MKNSRLPSPPSIGDGRVATTLQPRAAILAEGAGQIILVAAFGALDAVHSLEDFVGLDDSGAGLAGVGFSEGLEVSPAGELSFFAACL